MHGKQNSRAHKRGHNNASSSEYSSASSERSDATESEKSPEDNQPYNDGPPDGYPTSDESQQHINYVSGSNTRKGPMQHSYSHSNRGESNSDGASTQSESENEQDEGLEHQSRSPSHHDEEHDVENLQHHSGTSTQNGHSRQRPFYDRSRSGFNNDDQDNDGDDNDDDDDDEDVDANNYYQNKHGTVDQNEHSRDRNMAYSHSRSPSPSPPQSASPQRSRSASPVRSSSPLHPSSPRKLRGKRTNKPTASSSIDRIAAVDEIWQNYDPVVQKASKFCYEMALEPSCIAYGRLVGTGKTTVDYFVRMLTITIGRSGFGADCEVRSETRSISRRHAKLYWDEKKNHWMVTCLSSKNGMIVDGAPIAPFADPVAVNTRSLLEIGDVALFFLKPTETTFRVNDVTLLEENIYRARAKEEEFHAKLNAMATSLESRDVARKSSRNGKLISKADRSTGSKKNKKDLGKRASGKKSAKSGYSGKEVDEQQLYWVEKSESESSTSESEPEDEVVFDLLNDPKYKLPLLPPTQKGKRKHLQDKSDTNGKKRRRKGKAYDEDEGSTYEDEGYDVEWTKKEKTDFTRALFAVGVDAEYDDNGSITGFDWSRFRYIAEFPKKSDTMIEEYYRRVMQDVREMLDEEEREKKAKGPRTKHKPGCECNICENARKARRKRREELGVDERDGAASEEDAEARASSRGKDRLVGLVTAQKLRVRIGIHEAARHVEREAGYNVFTKLQAHHSGELKEMPSWWRPGYHDFELMLGCQLHGVGQWSDIWFDNNLEMFVRERQDRDPVDWPTPQATMKRVRDLASSIISEMKRIRKRDALEERAKRRDERRAARRSARRATSQKEGSSSKRKRTAQPRSRKQYSGDEYDEVPEQQGEENQNRDGESTVDESGSDHGRQPDSMRQDDGEATEDEEVEVEVEGEMHIEPEYEYYDENDGDYQGSNERDTVEGRADMRDEREVHGASTEDENEGVQGPYGTDDRGYGTVSDSGEE